MPLPVLVLIAALQADAIVTGQIRDAVTGVPLAGARVVLADADHETVTDRYGRYRIAAQPGPQHLTVSVLGYAPRALHALVPGSGLLVIDILLRPEPIPLDAIDVRSPAPVRGLEGEARAPPGRVVTRAEILHHPHLAEPDVLLALAGGEVVAAPEAPAGLHLRGGSADQTAYVLDGIPIFSPYHVAGVFGAFNPDAIGGLRVESAAPPAALPASLAGVVVAETRAPSDRVRALGALTTSHARASVDGPIGEGAFLVSWRAGFSNRLAPDGERSYPDFESGDLLVRAIAPVLGGRAALLFFDAEDEVDVAADAPEEDAPPPATNAFGWQSRSIGATWSRSSGATALDVAAWRALAASAAGWDPLGDPTELRSRREDLGVVATVAAHGWTLGGRVERIATDYAAARVTEDVVTAAVTLFAGRRLTRRSVDLDGTLAVVRAAGVTRLAPRGRVRWKPSERLAVDAAFVRSFQLAQSLRNASSVAGAVFPADLFVAAGSPAVPVARGDQIVVGVDWRAAPGLRFGANGFVRRTSGVLLTDRAGAPFVVDSIAVGSERARGIALEAAVSGARHALLLDYGWQDVRRSGDGTYVPPWMPAHTLGAGLRLYPTATSSIRLAVEGVAGRRGSDATGPFEWESCNLLDRGCEFGGTPVSGDPGASTLPAYLRLDLGGSKHWHLRVAGRQATIGLSATFSNLFGRRNVLVFASDPATGERTAVLMRPRAPLVIGVDWQF